MMSGGAAQTVARNGAVVALVQEHVLGAMEAATVVANGGAVAAGPAHEAWPSGRYVRPSCEGVGSAARSGWCRLPHRHRMVTVGGAKAS